MKLVGATYTKDGDGEVTGVSSTTPNTDLRCFKVGHRPANCIMEFDNFGSDPLFGSASDEWGMSTGNHSKGIGLHQGPPQLRGEPTVGRDCTYQAWN